MVLRPADVGPFYQEALAVAESSELTLHVRLHINAPADFHAVRWESLRDPTTGAPIATLSSVLLSRYLSSPDWRPIPVLARHDLRALAVVAGPSDIEEHAARGSRLAPRSRWRTSSSGPPRLSRRSTASRRWAAARPRCLRCSRRWTRGSTSSTWSATARSARTCRSSTSRGRMARRTPSTAASSWSGCWASSGGRQSSCSAPASRRARGDERRSERRRRSRGARAEAGGGRRLRRRRDAGQRGDEDGRRVRACLLRGPRQGRHRRPCDGGRAPLGRRPGRLVGARPLLAPSLRPHVLQARVRVARRSHLADARAADPRPATSRPCSALAWRTPSSARARTSRAASSSGGRCRSRGTAKATWPRSRSTSASAAPRAPCARSSSTTSPPRSRSGVTRRRAPTTPSGSSSSTRCAQARPSSRSGGACVRTIPAIRTASWPSCP